MFHVKQFGHKALYFIGRLFTPFLILALVGTASALITIKVFANPAIQADPTTNPYPGPTEPDPTTDPYPGPTEMVRTSTPTPILLPDKTPVAGPTNLGITYFGQSSCEDSMSEKFQNSLLLLVILLLLVVIGLQVITAFYSS